MTAYVCKDTKSGRDFHFTGELLAHETTNRPGRPRWSELTIYRTLAGAYILVKTGRSIVYHTTRECSRAGKHFREAPCEEGVPCKRCGIAPLGETVFYENDLSTVIVAKTAEGLVESAHLTDDLQVVFLPQIAHRALVAAGKIDADIATAYASENVA